MSETTRVVQRYDCDDPYTLHESINGSLVDYFEYERVVAERDATASTLADCERKLDAAVRERGELEYVLKNTTGMLQATSAENDTLSARLAACEPIVAAAKLVSTAKGDGAFFPALRVLTQTVRAAVAAETSERRSPITAGDTQEEK